MDTKRNNNVVDVSCFLIFEATGDSEADLFVDPIKATGGTTTTIRRDYCYDVDDAESCSYNDNDNDDDDDSDDDNFHGNNNEVDRRSFYDNVQVCLDDREEEGEEADSYYYPTWPHEEEDGQKNSSSSSHEELLLSEMEKNKLFWETCLAS